MSSNITLPTVGSTLTGKVKITLVSKDENKKPFGVIVSLDGGASGLLHVSEMKGGSFNARNQRLANLKKGDEVTVEVIEVTPVEGKPARVALSEKVIEDRDSQAKNDAILAALSEGTEVTGVVKLVKESFAIVTVTEGDASGTDVLLHVSQLPGSNPKERDAQLARLTAGQSVTAEVTESSVEKGQIRARISMRVAAVRAQMERFGVGSTHTGDIVKRLDHGFVVSFGAVSGVLSDEEACSSALKVGGRTRARVLNVDGDGKVTLTRRGLK